MLYIFVKLNRKTNHLSTSLIGCNLETLPETNCEILERPIRKKGLGDIWAESIVAEGGVAIAITAAIAATVIVAFS